MTPIDLSQFPRNGDVIGNADPGHRVNRIFAAVLVQPDGSEGLLSQYPMSPDNEPLARITFVTSDPKLLRYMKRMLAATKLEPGTRIEWREYRLSE